MYTINVNEKRKKSMSVQSQRLLLMMAAIMMTLVTFNACIEDNENGLDPDENENGGVSGKRIKTVVSACSIQGETNWRSERTYNSNGTTKRIDHYDASSKLIMYSTDTYNSDGTLAKSVAKDASEKMISESTFTYNSNKILQKQKVDTYLNGDYYHTSHFEYFYENGKRSRLSYYVEGFGAHEYTYNYDVYGRLTTTVWTMDPSLGVNTCTYTRTYHSDGTLQKITYPYNGDVYPPFDTVTETYTWEKGKTSCDFSMYEIY